MSAFLTGHPRVLEIGVGDGRGTAQLCADGHEVVGIDINPDALQVARELLRSRSLEVEVSLRGREFIENPGRIPSMRYKPFSQERVARTVHLIEADIIQDEEIVAWLQQTGPFDAIACWNIGVNGIRTIGRLDDGHMVQQPTEYRYRVQNRCYDLAKVVLRSGGILHFVDRGSLDTPEEIRKAALKSHREQAEGTPMEVESHDWRVIDDPNADEGIPIRPPTPAKVTGNSWILESIIARKP